MTVVARRFVSIPGRTALETWTAICDLLAPDRESDGHKELRKVDGIASMLITEEASKSAPMVLHGSGPRVRVYCLYGDDAILGDGANETALTFVATDGDWTLSLPCPPDDLAWVQDDLKKRSPRVLARDMNELAKAADTETEAAETLPAINLEAFFRT